MAWQTDGPVERQADHSHREAQDPGKGQRPKRLAGNHEFANCDEHRCYAARDWVDLSEVAVIVGERQEQVIASMEQNGECEQRPDRRLRALHEEQEGQRDHAPGQGDRGHDDQPIAPNLNQRIPARVQGGGEQDGGEQDGGGARINRVARWLPVAAPESGLD
jgi:hypothetical protein